MRVFNTMSRQIEELTPIEKDYVRIYTCGPTVYDYAHVGNFRAYMFEDLLRRYLKFSGFRVTQVMNLTDVDDKTIRAATAAGVSLKDYTQTFKDAFFTDLKELNIEPAEHYPAATSHIQDMIEIIKRLMDAGYAYKSDDGSVYYEVAKFAGYGKLAHIDRSGMKAGARVAQDEYDKDNVADFALWKAWDEEDGEVVWDSPWGRGRPGWHIECSAMSMKYLGETFDIHTGGIDNMFPHHENEIAQSEGATGVPFVRYWMHCGYLIVDGQKMSKSLGNFYTLRQIIEKGYSGREVRYVLLSGHYRQQFNFTFDALAAARASLARIDEFFGRIGEVAAAGESAVLPAWAKAGQEAFVSALDEDLNMPEALGALFDMIRTGNAALDAGDVTPGAAVAVSDLMRSWDSVLGLLAMDSAAPDDIVAALVEQREIARKAKNWAESDRLRDEIAGHGWIIRDKAEGSKLKRMQ